ncbi:DUF5985 family protein [Aurantimonas sp. HBX-1]|uniref:DUF5985 family protein n=1 Tax=Aurantimonas sp. HBX-1 TaxID=2906072 RepID=UPI001F3BDD5B|nr:DUF5985 family protein [Aurantimonas sp. HBX-1]UIJ71764.1 DUF5985 family protein [Aurantimonas sp. HBX-1]
MGGSITVAIYILCLATSLTCTYLLLRAFYETRAKLLFWSGLCFGFLALNSFAVVLDIVVFPSLDFQLLRHLASLGAVSVLLVGFVWDIE